MTIITPKGVVDTDKEAVVLLFNDDNEMSSFISLLIKTPVRSTGARILTLIPDNIQLTPLQESALSILEGLDGIGGNDNEKICNDAIDGINGILKSNGF